VHSVGAGLLVAGDGGRDPHESRELGAVDAFEVGDRRSSAESHHTDDPRSRTKSLVEAANFLPCSDLIY
jgi:hypothetical protein